MKNRMITLFVICLSFIAQEVVPLDSIHESDASFEIVREDADGDLEISEISL